jgi:hypothetical protein
MNTQAKILFTVAFSTYAVLLFGIFFNQPELIFGYVFWVPGAAFAAFVLSYTSGATLKRGLAFFIFCCGLYYIQMSFITSLVFRNQFQFVIPVMSVIGAVFVTLVYNILFRKRMNSKQEMYTVAKKGFLVSLLTFVTSFIDSFPNDTVEQLVSVGFYSVFPFWTISISKHLLLKHNSA